MQTNTSNNKFVKNLKLCILLLLLLHTVACSRNNIKPGEIPPPPGKIESSTVQGSVRAVSGMAQEEGSTLVKTGADWQRVKRIMDKISKASDMGPYPYPIFIAQNDDPATANAFIYEGNTVVVYSSLLTALKSDAELATVLAHETGHMLGKHHEDKTEESRGETLGVVSSILGTVTSVGVSVATGSSGIGNMAGDVTSTGTAYVGKGAFVKAYSRDMEREADTIGIVLMAKAGYDPRAAVDLWKRADEIFGGGSGSSFMSSHPSNEDRAEELEAQLDVALKFYEAEGKGEKGSGKKKK